MKSFIKQLDQKGFSLLALLASDIFWYFASFLAAYYFRNSIGVEIQPVEVYLRVTPYALLLLILVFHIHGLYQKKNRLSKFSEIFLISKSLTICLVLIMAASFLQKYDYSRALVILFWIFSLVFLNFGRFLIRLIKKKLIKKGFGHINVLIIGAGKSGKNLARSLEKYREFGYFIKGFLDDNTRQSLEPYDNLGTTNDLTRIIQQKNIHEVYISDPAMSHDRILELIQQCEHLTVKFKVVSDLFEIIAGSIDISEIEGIPTIDLQGKNTSPMYHFLKRIIDLVLALIGMLILLPFWLIIIFLVKIDSPGPTFFCQKRVGKNAREFIMYKFRSMHNSASKNEFSPHREDDNRITKIGKLLRKTSLDETPQLINVLKGEMSIVGPRPEMPFIVEKYKSWQRRRLEVKPGITGLWQVLGRKDLPLLDNLEYDFYYIKNQSTLLDIVIIFRTFLTLITGKGAY